MKAKLSPGEAKDFSSDPFSASTIHGCVGVHACMTLISVEKNCMCVHSKMSTLLVTIACYFVCTASAESSNFSSPLVSSDHQGCTSGAVVTKYSNSSRVNLCDVNQFNSCPPGMFCKDGYCKCGWHPHKAISCNGSNSSSVIHCYCVTFDEETNATLIGSCIYNCGHLYNNSILYSPLPKSIHQLNKACDSLNRTGALCGRCKSGHYPLAYSFKWTCIKCPHACTNWVRYNATAYLPLTVFCFLILFFKVNIASSHFYPVVWLFQLISMPASARSWTLASIPNRSQFSIVAVKILLSIYGIWNLDFFRPFYSDFVLE